MKFRSLLVAQIVLLGAPAFIQTTWAQDQAATDPVEAEDGFIITGSPLGQSAADTIATVTVVDREKIVESGVASLGDLLASEPGISQSSFAAGASRPIVRGLDNFRVRVQENGVGTHDASALSEDHGIPIDPLSATRVEVVRGPAVLRYGSEAIGGVVNVINNRIPSMEPDGGLRLEGISMYSTVDNGWQSSAAADFGANGFAGHVDAFFRVADDYETPRGTQIDTYVEQSGGSIGGSAILPNGYVGASVAFFQSEYGIPAAEEPLFIEMEQLRVQMAGEFDDLSPALPRVSFTLGFTDYTHDEVAAETGEVGSTFDNNEIEGRAEFTHAAIGPFDGVFGFQARHRDLVASGEGGELLAPSETRALGAFLFEETRLSDNLSLQMAARIDRVEIDGTGFLPILPDGLEFAASRDFTPYGGSVGLVLDLGNDRYLSGTAQVVQRAPDVLELFAKGPHESTETFELGNPDLGIETARGLEVTLEQLEGPMRYTLAAYYTSFEDFIFKDFTGIECGEEFNTCGVEDELMQIAYTQEDATFMGFEASAELDVHRFENGAILSLEGQADLVQAELDNGGNIPRIPPFRYGAGVRLETDQFSAHTGFLHVAEQRDLGAFEVATDPYTMVRAGLTYRFEMPNTDTPFEVGIAASNLFDEEARNHASFKKDDVTLPGRSIRIFLRARF